MRKFKAKQSGQLLEILNEEMGYASVSKGRKIIKSGRVKVDGNVIRKPSQEVKEGSHVVLADAAVQRPSGSACPFPLVFENELMLAFEKPAGLLTASPDKKKKTAFTLVKNWLLENDTKVKEAYFVNKLPREASGIVLVAKTAPMFKQLRDGWNSFPKRYYVLAQGFFDEDGVIGNPYKKLKVGEKELLFPYRLMSQGDRYALLRVEMEKEAFSEFFSMMETKKTPIPGYSRRGKGNNPIGRLAFHFFSIEVPISNKESEVIKTRVPRDFIKLVKHNQV